VGEIIGADWMIYQDLEDLVTSAAEGNPAIKRFECSVFNGDYVTGDVDESYLAHIDQQRNDNAKSQDGAPEGRQKNQVIGIHNNNSEANVN
jgi:amidophosphoribosyltransferase